MSFARSKLGKYHYPAVKSQQGQTLIVLDGQKLMAAGFSGKPVDYWGWGDKDEMEDRVYSDKPVIPNANKFIKEIHMLMDRTPEMKEPGPMDKMMNPDAKPSEYPRDQKRDDIYIRLMRNVFRASKQLDIPVYIYKDVKSFNLLDKRNATSSLGSARPSAPAPKSWSPTPRSGRRRNPFADYMEMLKIQDKSKLSPEAKKRLDNMEGWYKDDSIRSLAADVHNARTSDARPKLDALIEEMKKLKIYTLTGLVDHLIKKFKVQEVQEDGGNDPIEKFETYIKDRHAVEVFSLYAYNDDIKLDTIIVGDKKQGTGTAVMNELVAFADKLKKRVILSPAVKDDHHGTTSRSRLVKFYKRFGFQENKGRNKDFSVSAGMIRNPK